MTTSLCLRVLAMVSSTASRYDFHMHLSCPFSLAAGSKFTVIPSRLPLLTVNQLESTGVGHLPCYPPTCLQSCKVCNLVQNHSPTSKEVQRREGEERGYVCGRTSRRLRCLWRSKCGERAGLSRSKLNLYVLMYNPHRLYSTSFHASWHLSSLDLHLHTTHPHNQHWRPPQ